MNNSFKIKNGVNVASGGTGTESGDITVNANRLEFHNGTSPLPVLTTTSTDTITNKSIDADTNTLTNIANAAIKAAAGIVYSKLTLTDSVVNADINSAAGIVDTKLATISTSGKVSNSATTATSANTNSAIVARDGSGNFSAGTITASLTGNVTGNVSGTALNVTGVVAKANGGTGVNLTTDPLELPEISTPSTPSSGFGKVYFKSDGSLYQLNDDGAESKVGAGSAGINYVVNPDAESNTSGWSVYNNTSTFDSTGVNTGTDTITTSTAHALLNDDKVVFTSSTTLPAGLSAGVTYYIINKTSTTFKVSSSLGGSAVDITDGGTGTHTVRPLQPPVAIGGAGNITLTRSTSSPLRGVASFLLTKDAATRAGEGIVTTLGATALDLNINRADLAKILQVSFDYEIASGTFVAGSDSSLGDLSVYIYDVTNGRRIELSPFKITGGVVGTKYRYQGVFQSDSVSRQYRLAIHVSSASSSAYTVKFDNVQVGPQVKEFGAPLTDWTAYTPTYTGFGTVVTSNMFYRRVGGNIEIQGRFLLGTPTAVEARISLPTGLISGGSDVISENRRAVGNVVYDAAAAATFYSLIEPSTAYLTVGFQGAGTGGLNKINGDTFGVGTLLSVQACFPITGWSSSLQMSSDADTRVVAASYTVSGAVSVSPTQPIDYATKIFDTHSAVTTGSSWKFTAPVNGYYRISIAGAVATAITDMIVYKNSTQNILLNDFNTTTFTSGSGTVQLNSGDYIDIRSTGGAQNTNGTSNFNNIHIERISGPEQIAASEKVKVRYTSAAGAALTGGSPIDFDTKEYDTHGAVTTGASWKFTSPRPGYVKFNLFTNLSGTADNALLVFKNGAAGAVVALTVNRSSATSSFFFGMGTVKVNAGDELQFRPSVTAGTLLASSDQVYVELEMD